MKALRVLLAATATVPMTLLGVGGTVSAAASTAAPNFVCSGVGTLIPAGTYGHVTVTGLCAVEGSGVVNIRDGLTVAPGAGLDASGRHCMSFVNVAGGVDVLTGAVLSFGNSFGTGCTTSSSGVIEGGLRASSALAVIVHGTTIHGGFASTGGGGGTSCGPMVVQDVNLFLPPYNDLEDSHVDGGVSISGLSTCWLGVIRDHINGTVRVNNNTMGDPDAIEIGLNTIHGSLECAGNGLAFPIPGGVPTNSFDGSPPNPNIVTGSETGQCAGL